MKITGGTVSALALALAASGCSKPAPSHAAAAATVTAPVSSKLAAGVASIPCPGGLTDQGGKPYTMTVLPNFHVQVSGHKRATPKLPKANPGQLDTTTALQDNQYANVEIILNGTLDWGATPFALKTGAPQIFCDLNVVGQTMTFKTYRQPGGPTSSSYALGLVVHDPNATNEALNVIIDPGMDNDGIESRNR